MIPPRVLPTVLSGVLLALASPSTHAAQSRAPSVVNDITTFNASLPPAVRAEKYARMKESVFSFYRGSNHLFWKDFGGSPQLLTYGGTSATRTWLSGDMHVDNTGAFDDDHGDIVFGLNDFDEAVIGDYQLDVWRMAISLVLVARDKAAFNTAEQDTLVDAFSEAYLDAMARFADQDGETTKRFLASNTYGLLNDFLRDVASHHGRAELLGTWTVKRHGLRQFDPAHHPDLAAVSPAVDSDLRARMDSYRSTLGDNTSWPASYFAVKGVVQRLHAGLGSLGTSRYYVLIEGPTASQDDDRLLDVKAQRLPSAWPFLPASAVSQTRSVCGDNMAVRTVKATQALGYRVDDHLGWMTLADGASYSVRELSAWRESFPTAQLDTRKRFLHMAEQWGQVLATHHARADKDWAPTVFPASLDGEIHARTNGDHAGFRARVRAIATDYATQVRLDSDAFRAGL